MYCTLIFYHKWLSILETRKCHYITKRRSEVWVEKYIGGEKEYRQIWVNVNL